MEENVLILCRAIPEDSKKYFQTVCVAGINDANEFRRLYPVPFKPYVNGGGIPFHKKHWIKIDLSPTYPRDQRIESRKVDMRTIKIIRKIDNIELKKTISPLVKPSIKEIEKSGASLGIIKPDIIDYECEIISTETSSNQVRLTSNGSLAAGEKIKLDQHSYYIFTCSNKSGCSCENRPHKMEILDWEVNELYRNIIKRTKNKDEIKQKMKQKFEWIKNTHDVYFMMGTHHRWKTWMIVSILYLPKQLQTVFS